MGAGRSGTTLREQGQFSSAYGPSAGRAAHDQNSDRMLVCPAYGLRVGRFIFGAACITFVLSAFVAAGLAASGRGCAGQTDSSMSGQKPSTRQAFPDALVASGRALFEQDCAFCHGRDAAGGETGPDLTRSTLVAQDLNGNKIGPVIQNGRLGRGMPAFDLATLQISGLVAFVHTQRAKMESQAGGRRGVDIADLQTGNVEAGKAFFNGAGKCSSCHSPQGDLGGIASRYQAAA